MFNQKIIFNIPGCDALIGSGVKSKKFLCNNHFHNELELLYMKKGCIRFFIGDETADVKEGDVFFVNSNIPHITKCMEDESEDILLQFSSHSNSNSPISYLFSYIKKDDVSFFHFKKGERATVELIELITKVYKEENQKERAYDYYIAAYIQCIEALLHRHRLLPDAIELLKHKKLERLLPLFEYIDASYEGKITLSDLSRVMHLNESYLCRLFKEITGNGVSDYINYVRVYKSVQLLKTDKTLSEIADSCGFFSLAYFNKIFKKFKGYTPGEFRKLRITGEVAES